MAPFDNISFREGQKIVPVQHLHQILEQAFEKEQALLQANVGRLQTKEGWLKRWLRANKDQLRTKKGWLAQALASSKYRSAMGEDRNIVLDGEISSCD